MWINPKESIDNNSNNNKKMFAFKSAEKKHKKRMNLSRRGGTLNAEATVSLLFAISMHQ